MTKFNLFNDVDNTELRTWNRCAMIFNIGASHGPKAMASYAENFSKEDRQRITAMFNRIEQDGYEKTKAAMSRDVQKHHVH